MGIGDAVEEEDPRVGDREDVFEGGVAELRGEGDDALVVDASRSLVDLGLRDEPDRDRRRLGLPADLADDAGRGEVAGDEDPFDAAAAPEGLEDRPATPEKARIVLLRSTTRPALRVALAQAEPPSRQRGPAAVSSIVTPRDASRSRIASERV